MKTNGTRIRTMALLAAMIVGLGACGGSPQRESTGEFVDDTAITTKVKAAFIDDPVVAASRINVETFKGVVQLSGFAKSYDEAQKAESLAYRVKGVKSVKNDIAIR